MSDPLVSVIIPTIGREDMIVQAIESALRQRHAQVEVLVVDDGATDGSAERAARFPGVRVLRQGQRTGVAVARNRAIGEARGAHVAFLDDDDRLRPGALEVGLRELAARPRVGMTFGRAQILSDRPEEAGLSPAVAAAGYTDVLRGVYPVQPAAALFRRDAVLSVGGFDVWRGIAQDYELYLRLARRYPIHAHEAVVSEYRKHAGSVYNTRGARACLEAVLAILELHRPGLRTPDEVRAWLDARERWRRLFGDALPWEALACARSGDVKRAWSALGATLRHAPRESLARFATTVVRRFARRAAAA